MFDYARDFLRFLVSPPKEQAKALAVIKRMRLGRHYLGKCGYWRSLLTGRSIDQDGNPIPWMNYAMVGFLKERLSSNMTMFEYGSGYSSLFFASYCRSVLSLEHNRDFYELFHGQARANNDIRLVGDSIEDYCGFIKEGDTLYDVIVIDGLHRNECAKQCLDNLTPNGVILFDDINEYAWDEGIRHLKEIGFKQLTMGGLKPQSYAGASTSVGTMENFVPWRGNSNMRRPTYEHRQSPFGSSDGRPQSGRSVRRGRDSARTDQGAGRTSPERRTGRASDRRTRRCAA
ncbi:class I SAM-dependent methyltransferase [Cohaesibacter sp. ES.047]|uniref:class I SAM-dependent methyltransferase n=1 Tax=Cohaesibacter sp. ES.047 TaxID=1798205 RepID=UPI000BB775A3|nr:class I SAM-dependent methyltransferase [Cohaesibacter sp. ES.047]